MDKILAKTRQRITYVPIIAVVVALSMSLMACSAGVGPTQLNSNKLISYSSTEETLSFELEAINGFEIAGTKSSRGVFADQVICSIDIEHYWSEGDERYVLLACSTYEILEGVTVLHSVPLIVKPGTHMTYRGVELSVEGLEDLVLGGRYYHVQTETSIQNLWIILDSLDLEPLDEKFADVFKGDILETYLPGDKALEDRMKLEISATWLNVSESVTDKVAGYAFSNEESIVGGVAEEKYFTLCVPDRVESGMMYHTFRVNYETTDIEVDASHQQEFEIHYKDGKLWLVEE